MQLLVFSYICFMKHLKPLMFVGTCSDAGKSIINTAFCRILKQDGYLPAPFKAQNMSLNSYPTPEGGEIGRAQVVQAEAAGVIPHTDMNPVLLKPTNNKSSQVILNGKPMGNLSAVDYFGDHLRKGELFEAALAAFKRLDAAYNPVVLEGAGSISEINLRDRDITNMRMAMAVGAATYLVADIDRGGVFGSVYGTIQLLRPEERALIKGIIINKFRGDIRLFETGKQLMEELTGIPVTGIIPYFTDIRIEEEDSVALESKRRQANGNRINVAIVHLRRLSNFTDFNVLEMDPRFHTYFTDQPDEIEKADIVVLPGTKNTLGDLQDIRSNGIASAIVKAYKAGKKVIGICGGYQMMGMQVEDPQHLEGSIPLLSGLGLLPMRTVIESEKVIRQTRFRFLDKADLCNGYEIHMGKTSLIDKVADSPLVVMEDGRTDGYLVDNRCWGSYMHGILDNPAVLDYLAEGLVKEDASLFNYAEFKEKQYDKLADHVRAHVDMDAIYRSLTE